MERDEAIATVMGLPAETREAIALFIEDSYDRHNEHWGGPDDVSLYSIAKELRDGKPYVYEPPLPVYGCKTEWEQQTADMFSDFVRNRYEQYSTFTLTREHLQTSQEPIINWDVVMPSRLALPPELDGLSVIEGDGCDE